MLEPHTLTVLAPFIILSAQILFYLLTIWSITLRTKVFYSKGTSDTATHVLFYPKPHKGQKEIVELIRPKENNPYTVYQQKRRELIDGKFVSLKYPVHEKISFYYESKGLTTKESNKAQTYFGTNTYDIPIPSFRDLLIEHMLAPFFVFQVFSAIVLIFDSYWYYPFFTLVSLVLIEANTVRTRQSNMLELRGTQQDPVNIKVLRDGTWKTLKSDALVPGDLVFFTNEFDCPADMLLLSGRVVVNEAMLTGESTPQVKEPASSLDKDTVLATESHRRFILFGGTRIEQVLPEKAHIYTEKEGAVAYVLSTGLGSSQGKLLRTILFASDRVSAASSDSTKLLIFLTFFAVAAGSYIVYFGVNNASISSFWLIVNVLKIITSTIPPDLPMQLTFAVNASLLALSKLKVFCTEPFRIPFAGTVSVCCFDKTGTLTAEEYDLVGIDEMDDSAETVTVSDVTGRFRADPEQLSAFTQMVIGGCNSLVQTPYGRLIGDELEAAAFTKLGFKFTAARNIKNKSVAMALDKTFHFSAELRRMSTIVTQNNPRNTFVVTKGAPEVIAEFLTEVPQHYFEAYRQYTKQGCRVLALAYRQLSNANVATISREDAERDLTFAGFAIFAAPWKKGTEDTIVALLNSTHRVVVITGDDPLTACHVATKLHVLTQEAKICDGDYDASCNCFTGRALRLMVQKGDTEHLHEVVRRCNVFARTQPEDKSLVVRTLKELGFKTMMCGDGTNDVNALKTAECGIGLLERSVDTAVNEDEYAPKLGAASIAAPFVSKRSTISSCVDIIRFGRATLSSTIDIFKIMSLNCIITAYCESVLFIDNVKFGDLQMTAFSIFSMISYMTISMAKPIRTLSKERPFDSQFNGYLVVSVLLQFIVHVAVLYFTRKFVFDTGYVTLPFDNKIEFTPSLMNTAFLIITSVQTTATFLANYRGLPFMTSFFENKALLWSIVASYVLVAVVLADVAPAVNEYLGLVKMSTDFRVKLAVLSVVDTLLCLVCEKVTLFLFTLPKKREAQHLVSQETLDAIKDYKPHRDDELKEELHKFNFVEMMRQNFALQKQMLIRRAQSENQERLKKLNQKKGKLSTQEKRLVKSIKEQQKRIGK